MNLIFLSQHKIKLVDLNLIGWFMKHRGWLIGLYAIIKQLVGGKLKIVL